MNPKQRAAEAALEYLADDMVVGLGTGSTADFFLAALAEALRAGRLRGIRGIPTSRRSEARARELGIPLTGFADVPRANVTVDGADEIAPNLDLIKGLGGALLREKIVAQNSDQLIIIADESKEVPVLGTKSALPVEVVPFGVETHEAFLKRLGCETKLRVENGKPLVTDGGNLILDCRFARIDDPAAMQETIRRRAGVVETGLFLGLASVAIIADGNGVRTRRNA